MSEFGAEGVITVGQRQHGRPRALAHDRRQLEEIADQHDLHSTKRGTAPLDVAADRIDQTETLRWQHRDFVNDQHFCPLDAGNKPAIGGEHVQITGVECLAHADPAPGVDGHAMPVRGRDAGRGGVGVFDAFLLQPTEVAIDSVSFAAAGLAGEED